MAVGTKTYKGMAVPLNGEAHIKQITAATDIWTVTRITAGTGDFLVLRQNDGTEELYVESTGDLMLRAGNYINLGATVTTAPTTGMVKGDVFIGFAGSVPRIGICSSTAAQTIKYIRTRSKSFGSASA